MIRVRKEKIRAVMRMMRDHTGTQCKGIIDIVGIEREGGVGIVYIIITYRKGRRYRIRVDGVEEGIETITREYKGGEWLEREVYDMFGVEFRGHRDMRRILTDYGAEGNPMRKEYPLMGYEELYYSEEEKRLKWR